MKLSRNRIVDIKGDVFGHFLLSALSEVMNEGMKVPNPEEYDVNLTVNGVELPVEQVFMNWHNKLEESVERRAEELFKEKFRDVNFIFEDLAQSISTQMDEAKYSICNKLNLEYNPYD